MNCAEYWESQGVDPLDAMLTVGCRVANTEAVGVINGHDLIGALVFVGLIVAAVCFAKVEGQL